MQGQRLRAGGQQPGRPPSAASSGLGRYRRGCAAARAAAGWLRVPARPAGGHGSSSQAHGKLLVAGLSAAHGAQVPVQPAM